MGDRLSANEALGILEGKEPRPAGSRWDFSAQLLMSHPAYPPSPDTREQNCSAGPSLQTQFAIT